MLARGQVHDPGIGFITLTHVKVSADLQVAQVYYTTLGDAAARRGELSGQVLVAVTDAAAADPSAGTKTR